MCIRDREGALFWQGTTGTNPGNPISEAAVDALFATYGVAGSAVSAGSGTVSYTHLRAHETVLDLVCRLLLEKKKNKHTTPPIIQRECY